MQSTIDRSLTACLAAVSLAAVARAQVITPAPIPLPGSAIPQFVDRLPTLQGLDPLGTMSTLVNPSVAEVHMREVRANVLPSTFAPPAGWPGGVAGTVSWSYIPGPNPPTGNVDSFIGPVVLAQRNAPTEVRWYNDLGSTATSRLRFWQPATDQTIHWADPLGSGHNMLHYRGPIPAVPHLHGGEVPPQLDGGPDAWYTSDGLHQGIGYYTRTPATDPPNSAFLRYPNSQEAANLWFHDHTLGITRLNVYAGLAGAWVLGEPAAPANLPGPLIPLVIQDRSFDTNGQLLFPATGINPEHPFWVPEFVGDSIVVNGKTWPYLNVEPKRYRFLFLNGSNARTYDMFFSLLSTAVDAVAVPQPKIWVLGTDGGYLDVANQVKSFVLMPGERYEVILDFTGIRPGTNLLLRNSAPIPYPGPAGAPDPLTTGRIMQFRVVAPFGDGYSPGTYVPGTALRGPGGAGTQPPIVRLPGAPGGPPISDINVQRTRQVTLNEVMGPGGPLEVLVNNSKWGGLSVATDVFPGGVRPDFPLLLHGSYVSELPAEGETEVWEIVNMTADAHPIHLHLVQFQLIDRQNYNLAGYQTAYDALFPGSTVAIDPMTGLPYAPGVFMGGFGPPLAYDGSAPQSAGKLGGNPDVYANGIAGPLYMLGTPSGPKNYEKGWKDTVVVMPNQVTRLAVRWTPTDVPLGSTPSNFVFDPYNGFGYVWHCHIIDHEDNEMMRPTAVVPDPTGIRSYNLGVDF